MGPLGVPELIFILVIALLIFGPKRLPEFGRTIGKALGEFRRASTDLKRSIDVELSAADEPARPKPAAKPREPAVARVPTSTLEPVAQSETDETSPVAEVEESDADESEPEASRRETEDESVN